MGSSFLGGLSGSVVQFVFAWASSQYGAVALGGTLLAGMLPSLLLTFVGGVFADRNDARRMLFAGAVVSAVVLFTTTWWHAVAPAAVVFMVSNFALSVTGAVFGGSSYVIPAALFPKDELVRINANLSLADDAAYLVGPLLAAAIFLATGVVGSLLFAAAVGLVAGAWLLALPPVPRSEATEALNLKFVAAGFVYISKTASTMRLVLFFATTNVLAAAFQVASPFFADALGGAQAYALLLSAMNLGMTASNLALSAVPIRASEKLIFASGLFQGLALAALGRSRSLPGAVVFGAVHDAMANMSSTVFISYLQAKVPEALLGRVFAAVNTLAMLLTPLGFASAPWLIARLGAATSVVALGLVSAAVAAIFCGLRGCLAKES
ncbi:MFS transporter [Oceanithermus desulfurans NBRC 100063]|uniref:MFS transporter n=1 Tax=Oceanithermus desulfurans NBRC 100063 TaxID=1227550 RepID=A0A511RK26_9DEIN|nr:MFS transporter [Oceanithermus desulfurans NBRC 100063]